MKASELRIVKGIRSVIKKYFVFKEGTSLSISTHQVAKGSSDKDIEKGNFDVSFDVSEDAIPEVMDADNFVCVFKQALSNELGHKIRYLAMNWAYSEWTEEKDKERAMVNVSFCVKMDM